MCSCIASHAAVAQRSRLPTAVHVAGTAQPMQAAFQSARITITHQQNFISW